MRPPASPDTGALVPYGSVLPSVSADRGHNSRPQYAYPAHDLAVIPPVQDRSRCPAWHDADTRPRRRPCAPSRQRRGWRQQRLHGSGGDAAAQVRRAVELRAPAPHQAWAQVRNSPSGRAHGQRVLLWAGQRRAPLATQPRACPGARFQQSGARKRLTPSSPPSPRAAALALPWCPAQLEPGARAEAGLTGPAATLPPAAGVEHRWAGLRRGCGWRGRGAANQRGCDGFKAGLL